VPNDLSTIDKAVASYVSFTTKAWGKSLYQSDYFKKLDYPTTDIVNQMNSEDHKKNGYYKHFLTLHLTYDTTEVAACFVETYYSKEQPKVSYLLMFERKGNAWYLLAGSPYHYLKSLSQIKFHYLINLLQGLKMKPEDPNAVIYNELLSKLYKNNIFNLNILLSEIIPSPLDKEEIVNSKKKYAVLVSTPKDPYAINWNLISNAKINVKSFVATEDLFPTYFENMTLLSNKYFIFDESKLDFSTEESALASLYSTQSKATFDLHTINCTYNPYWSKTVREVNPEKSLIRIRDKIGFNFNSTYYSIVTYDLVLNGEGLPNICDRFIRKIDNATATFSFYKDETKGNYKLDEITWMLGCMEERFLRKLCGLDPVTDPAETALINKLKKDSKIDFYKIIQEWYKTGSSLKKYIKRPN